MTANNRWTCPNCARPYRLQIGAQPPALCPSCEKAQAAQRTAVAEAELVSYSQSIDSREQDQVDLDAAAAHVLLTTSNRLDGHQVEETLQLIAIERVCIIY